MNSLRFRNDLNEKSGRLPPTLVTRSDARDRVGDERLTCGRTDAMTKMSSAFERSSTKSNQNEKMESTDDWESFKTNDALNNHWVILSEISGTSQFAECSFSCKKVLSLGIILIIVSGDCPSVVSINGTKTSRMMKKGAFSWGVLIG